MSLQVQVQVQVHRAEPRLSSRPSISSFPTDTRANQTPGDARTREGRSSTLWDEPRITRTALRHGQGERSLLHLHYRLLVRKVASVARYVSDSCCLDPVLRSRSGGLVLPSGDGTESRHSSIQGRYAGQVIGMQPKHQGTHLTYLPR